ncbi:MAG TPA: MFS transporter [Anaerolineales bacterium]
MKRLPIISLYAANAISMVGNVLASIAIPWFVLQTTGSAVRTGITGFFTILPVVIAGLLGGALIDRLGYKPTSIIADIASSITVLLIPLLHFTIGLQFWQLMLLVFLGGLLDAPGTTAREALIPDLAQQAGVPLERATSIGQVVERASRLVGAPLCGILIAVMGTANVLWLDAASFVVSAALVAAAVHVAVARPAKEKRTRYVDEIFAGWKFMRTHKLILSMIVIVMVTNFVDAAFGGVLLPVYVKRVYGNALNLGLFIGVMGGGSVLGAVIFGWIGHRLPRFATFVAGFILTSLYVWGLALFLPFPVLLAAATIAGVGAGPLNPIIGTVIFERVPSDMRGRILGSIQAGAWITMPLGMLVAGVLTEWLGLQPLLLGLAVLYLGTTGSMLLIPVLRQLDQRLPANAQVPTPQADP